MCLRFTEVAVLIRSAALCAGCGSGNYSKSGAASCVSCNDCTSGSCSATAGCTQCNFGFQPNPNGDGSCQGTPGLGLVFQLNITLLTS